MVDFTVVNAFTTSTYGGNPAAVLFLDSVLPTETLLKVGRILSQPITTYVFPPSEESTDEKKAIFGLRWFTQEREVPLCGHGTLAAAHALFYIKPEMLSKNIELLEFETMNGIVSAWKAPGGKIEIQMPASPVIPVSEEKASKVRGVLATAFDREDMAIKFIGSGTNGRSDYLLIELDEKENLADAVINTSALVNFPVHSHAHTDHDLNYRPERRHTW